MKRLLAVVVVGVLMVWALPAQAHHTTWAMFLGHDGLPHEGYTWTAATHSVYFTDELNQKLTTAQFDFAQESFDQATQTWNNNITGATLFDFQYGLISNWNFMSSWNTYDPDSDLGAAYCNNVPFQSGKTLSTVHLEDFGGAFVFTPTLTIACDKNNDGDIDWTAVAFNEGFDDPWHYNDDDSIPSSQQDFRSEATIAWGISVGIDGGPSAQAVPGHWDFASSECGHSSSAFNSLCDDQWGSHGQRISMTLNTHDKGALHQAYP